MSGGEVDMTDLPANVLEHVVDVHCHPTYSVISSRAIEELPIRICAMATKPQNQELVASLARANPRRVIPGFGFHPWFAHWISIENEISRKEDHYRKLFGPQLESDMPESDKTRREELFEQMLNHLPDPISLSSCLDSILCHFNEFPEAMLGEVGLDRSARVPIVPGAEERRLSPFLIPFDHQVTILTAQLDLAVRQKRNISLHSVQAQKASVDLLQQMQRRHGEDWWKVSVDFHSCGLSPETWKSIEKIHRNAFLSLSTAVNGRSPNHRRLIEVVADTRILVESDINDIGQVSSLTTDMLRTVAEIKNWQLEDCWEEDIEESQWGAVRRLERNFQIFQEGNHLHPPKRRKAKKRLEL